MNFYKTEGTAQMIARSHIFENVTLAVIAINAIWIAVDSDHNPESVILRAPPLLQVAEHLFILYFSAEWLIRFLAFEQKFDCFKDSWFLFDSCLVFLMVVESWVMAPIIVITGTGSNSGL